MVLAFIVFMIISFLIYTDYLNIFYEDRIHPLITELNNRFNKPTKHIEKQFVWTYIEEPKDLNKDINIQLLNKEKNFTILFNFCLQIMNNKINKKYNAFHVISPENIKDYLPDFPIEMNADSKYPLKFRVDLLGSMLLSKYGGLFLSPCTLVMKSLDEIMYKLKFNYDLITFGGSERVINSCNNKNNPGNYVIAAKKDNPVITLYKDQMLENVRKDNFINDTMGEDLLANSISKSKSYRRNKSKMRSNKKSYKKKSMKKHSSINKNRKGQNKFKTIARSIRRTAVNYTDGVRPRRMRERRAEREEQRIREIERQVREWVEAGGVR